MMSELSSATDLPPVRRRDRSAPSIGLNLTSMIDVVFLLLVYFLVATDFKQSEEIYRLDLPERREGVALDPFELDDEPLRILVRAFGVAGDDYRLRIEGARGEVGDFESLYEFLAGRRIDGMGGGLFAEDHPVLESLRNALLEHLSGRTLDTDDAPDRVVSPEHSEALRALGYVE